MSFIYLCPSIHKPLAELRGSSKKGSLAVCSYEAIFTSLQQGHDPLFKRTKYGENRLRQCIKYDLGSGYRLVTIRRGGAVYFAYIGSHDDVDAWLEKNRNWLPPRECESFPVSLDLSRPCCSHRQEKERDIYEENLLAKMDEEKLKVVFAGLFKRPKIQTF